jgi:hypothetical protein
MSRARDHIRNHCLCLDKNLRQRLNDVFDSLVRREQPERKQNRLPFHAEPVLVEIWIEEWQIWNSMRHHVDLAARNFENFLQELGRQLAHHDEAVGELGNLFHDHQLVGIGLSQNRVQRRHQGIFKPRSRCKIWLPAGPPKIPYSCCRQTMSILLKFRNSAASWYDFTSSWASDHRTRAG